MEHTTEDKWRAVLVDEGTLETVIAVFNPAGRRVDVARWDHEYASSFRDESGALTPDGFAELANASIDGAREIE